MILLINTKKRLEFGLPSFKTDKSRLFDAETAGQEQQIAFIEKELQNSLSDSKGVIREMCNHIMLTKGKRVRPILVINSGLVFSPMSENLIYAATAAELIHMASLVHDDIIDESPLRRKLPSVNKAFGKHYAVLCGDYLFAKAFEILSKRDFNRSMGLMVAAIQNMCHGEIIQAEGRINHEIDMDIYYERISRKTAIFLANCCKSGASVAGADDEQIEIIGEFGLNIGYSFQIIDDILDYIGSIEVMGKPRGEDLRNGNITMPVIFLLENNEYKKWIKDIIEKDEITDKTVGNITIALKESGAIEKSLKIAQSHIDVAKKCLGMLPKSRYIDFLNSMADALQTRVN